MNDSLPLETDNPFYAQMCKIRYQINCHSILIVILIVPYKITLQRKNRHVASFFKAKGVGGGGRIIKKSKNLDKRYQFFKIVKSLFLFIYKYVRVSQIYAHDCISYQTRHFIK